METTREMLDEIKVRYRLGSDYALAKKVGVRKQTIAKWYLGQIPDAYGAARIAELLEIEPMKVIAHFEQLRTKDETKTEFWNKFLRIHPEFA
jgi:DNA-binding XRE family transcriptional regulator